MITTTTLDTNNNQPPARSWIAMVNRAIFIRAAVVAIMVGSVLTAVNQYDQIVGDEPLQLLSLFLVFLLPFAVVAIAQIAGAYQAYVDITAPGAIAISEGFLTTILSHGIPARSVIIGLIFGSLNAIIVLSNAYLISGSLASVPLVPLVPLGQAYMLPFLFGALAQAISYRLHLKGTSKNALFPR